MTGAPPVLLTRRDDEVRVLPAMLELLGALDAEARAAVVLRWGLGEVAWQDLPRLLIDRGAIRERARTLGWARGAVPPPDELPRLQIERGAIKERARALGAQGVVPPPDELAQLGLHGPAGPAWEVVTELGVDLGMPDRLAAQLGAAPPELLEDLTRALGIRHELLSALHRALVDPERVAAAVGALPRDTRLRLAGAPSAEDLARLFAHRLALSPSRPCAELSSAAIAAARALEAKHQHRLIEEARRAAFPAVPRPEAAAAPSTLLRAAALALHASNFDAVRAAERGGLELHVVALALAIRDEAGALDAGADTIVDRGLRYLVSAAAPSRALGEALLGLEPGQGGIGVAHLAWVTLVQLASLPEGRPCGIDTLAALAVADAEALQLEHPALRPRPTLDLAQRYMLVQLASVQALGLAWVVRLQGVALASEALRTALQRLPAGREPPAAGASSRPVVQRDGDDLLVEADDRVPLARLEPLAAHALPTAIGDHLRFRLTPSLLAPGQRAALLGALGAAVE